MKWYLLKLSTVLKLRVGNTNSSLDVSTVITPE